MGLLRKVSILIYMSRPWNWLRMQIPATTLGILCGLYYSGYNLDEINEILKPIITVASISAGGYIINDYFDRDIDAINEPSKPIPSGKIEKNTALMASIVLFIFGLISSFFIGKLNLIIAFIWVLFAVLYAYILKRNGYGIESFIFGFVMGLTIIFGSIAVLKFLYVPALLLGGFMTLYMTAAHATGTLKDLEGDSKAGCKTITILLGKDKTRHLIILMYFLSFAILLYIIRFNLMFDSLILLMISGIALITLFSNVKLLSKQNRNSIAKALSISKTFLSVIFILMGFQLILRE